ncbi:MULTISPECIES: SDR family oxidoreductase [unclassified Nocardioides]|uniref:SDR family oxidoreductase n=1 Tax=unclassified Nocardioides TaxID=2615069 RepID=UPI00362430AB
MPRRVVVTGSSSGIGRSLAQSLRADGAEVVGVDLAGAEIDADLATEDGRSAVVDAVGDLGGLDALVTCAGTSNPSALMVRLNYFGSVLLADRLRPLLAASSSPRVALVGSISGTQPTDAGLVDACLADDEAAGVDRADELVRAGDPHRIYPSTKSALAQWVRRTAVAPGWADAGIALNVVAPGVVLTPMSAGLVDDPRMRAVMDAAVPMPLGGYAPPEAVARVLAFLVSPETTHLTGQVLYVDGGAEVTLRPADRF